MGKVTFLGPQRLHPTLRHEIGRLGVDGPVAAVTAGWQERESEIEYLRAHLKRPVVKLGLYNRAEQLAEEDPELALAHRARQDRLKAIQRLYRYRLDYALEPARELLRREGPPELLEPERQAAIEALRDLDEAHLQRIREVHRDYERKTRPLERSAVLRHRREIAEILQECVALAVAGGHVAVLLNRMRTFGLGGLIGETPVFAWSAGAMALSERVVLFHDSPPQGPGNPEILDAGLGLFPGLVVLPHADRRLRLEDPARVSILARRFAPAVCVPFDDRAPALVWDADGLHWGEGAQRLAADGRVVQGKEAAA